MPLNDQGQMVDANGNPIDMSQMDQNQALLDKLNGMISSGQLAPLPQMPASATNNPYSMDYRQSTDEQAAGVNPAPFFSMLDQNGNLKSQYSLDPNKSEAFGRMKGIAESDQLSPWAALQMQQNQVNTQGQRDIAAANAQGGVQNGLNQLEATGGGTGSGAAAFLASQGGRNNMMAQQQIGAESQKNALGIQASDAQNKQSLLGQAANTETGALAGNAASASTDTQNANIFTGNRYNQLMQAYGAKQTAGAQVAASRGGGKK